MEDGGQHECQFICQFFTCGFDYSLYAFRINAQLKSEEKPVYKQLLYIHNLHTWSN